MRPALNRARDILRDKVTNEFSDNVIGAEIGVLRGENAREILREWSQVSHLYLMEIKPMDSKSSMIAVENLREWQKRTAWIIGDSSVTGLNFNNNYFDFVYIDGGHTYDPVSADIKTYWGKVKSGGVLCGHDYNVEWEDPREGVVKAVDEFVARYNLYLWTKTDGSSSDWVVVKP